MRYFFFLKKSAVFLNDELTKPFIQKQKSRFLFSGELQHTSVHVRSSLELVLCVSARDHRVRRQFVSSTDHCWFFASMFCIKRSSSSFFFRLVTVTRPPAPDTGGLFFLSKQRPGATLEPLFLRQRAGSLSVETGKTGSKLGTSLEPARKLPWWKRGNCHTPFKCNII